MSPMPRLGPKAPSLLLATLVVLAAALAVLSPAGAQGDAGNATGDGNVTGEGNVTGDTGNATGDTGNATGEQPTTGGPTGGDDAGADVAPRLFTVRSVEDGCPDGRSPCWDLTALPVLPGDVVEIHVDMTSGFHDFTIESLDVATPSPSNAVEVVTFTVPESITNTPIEYVCTIHPQTMVGSFLHPDMLGAAEEGVEVVEMGVHFLAYWVGVIAFTLLFIVYGATFFLFKYNETPAATDHWDRSSGAAGRMDRRAAMILALVIAVAAVALLAWAFTR